MSVSKRLGRVSQCAVSLIGVACLSVFANTERNGFIGVEGDAEFYKDGDDTIGIQSVPLKSSSKRATDGGLTTGPRRRTWIMR